MHRRHIEQPDSDASSENITRWHAFHCHRSIVLRSLARLTGLDERGFWRIQSNRPSSRLGSLIIHHFSIDGSIGAIVIGQDCQIDER